MNTDMTIESWSKSVAGLAVDALVDHGLVKKDGFDKATAIAAMEIQVRLSMGDYPPLTKL